MRIVGLAFGLLGLTACIPLAETWKEREDFPVVTAADQVPPVESPSTVRIMTWNLKFAGSRYDFFFDGWGDQVHMSDAEVQVSMDGIYALIAEQDPDILMAQEVDIGSKRSAYVDMAQDILDNTDFNYVAWVPMWSVDYIPEEGLGKVEMGAAVFSKYPIVDNVRINLPQSQASSAVTNYFWLHRAIQTTRIDVGDGRLLTVINNHPTAYALDGTKNIHIQMIADEAASSSPPMVVGGDLNVVPPGTHNLDDFADQASVDTTGVTEVTYTVEETESLLPFYEAYTPIVPLEDYRGEPDEAGQQKWFTHSLTPDVFWTQKLDYLFTDQQWQDGWTLQTVGDGSPATALDPMALSDHAPIVGELVLP